MHGQGPRPDEAAIEFADLPPAGMAWMLGLFVVATVLHGSGAAYALYGRLERWMVEQGARWLRLGVVSGSARAERFWQRRGLRIGAR